MFQHSQLRRARPPGQVHRVHDEISRRHRLLAAPDADPVVDEVNQDYDFRYEGAGEADRRPCYILQLVPKRHDSNLLRGRIWVDRDTYLIHRLEGEPAKSPSWWIKDLRLSTQYSDMGGIWLPTSSKGIADVRLFGPHSMTERTLGYRAASPVLEGPAAELARLQSPPARPYRPVPAAAVGAGVIIGR